MTTLQTPADVRAATAATYIAFIGSGFALASWAARIPQIRDGLGLSPSRLGLVLLTLRDFARVTVPAAALFAPYALWVTYAAYLNLGFWWLNSF